MKREPTKASKRRKHFRSKSPIAKLLKELWVCENSLKKTLKTHQDTNDPNQDQEEPHQPTLKGKKSSSKSKNEDIHEVFSAEEAKKKLDKLFENDEKETDTSVISEISSPQEKTPKVGQEKVISDIIEAEDRALGRVSKKVYLNYISFVGGWCFFVILSIAMTVWAILNYGSNWWLQYWSVKVETTDGDVNNLFYLGIYVVMSLTFSIVTLLRVAGMLFRNLKMAGRLHSLMAMTLLHASITSFFDRVPVGRILNRFSKDFDVIDVFLALGVSYFVLCVFMLLGDFFIALYSSSWILTIFVFVFMGVSFWYQEIYMNTNREVNRLESITKSPVIQMISETLGGMTIIRAFNREGATLSKYIHTINENQKNSVIVSAGGGWFSTRLSLASLTITIPCILWGFLISANVNNKTEDEALADIGLFALMLNYLFLLTDDISSFLQNVSGLETRLISLERCQTYTQYTNNYKIIIHLTSCLCLDFCLCLWLWNPLISSFNH